MAPGTSMKAPMDTDTCYDENCLHGGPEPSSGDVGDFCKAAASSCESCMEATRKVFLTVRGGDDAVDATALAQAEFDALFAFWSREKELGLITAESHGICFACAVDALMQGEAPNARFFVRLGAFVRLVAEYGLAAVKEAVGDDSEEARRRVAPLIAALAATTNDRGVARFLAAEIPCGCLKAMAADTACVACCRNLSPPATPMRCSRCKTAIYCNRACQMSDWKRHKRACVPIKAPE
jgi:hypothetical protein